MSIEIFQIREANQLRDIGIITDIPFVVRMFIPPLSCGFAKERHIKHVGFGSIDQVHLRFRQSCRNKVFLDGIGMYAVVDLGKIAADVPAELSVFFILETLELFDKIEFELHRNP